MTDEGATHDVPSFDSAYVPAPKCPPYAKIPSGEPISAAFLTSALVAVPGTDAATARGAEISNFRVDETSVIQGRHSTTFRLLLDWTFPATNAASRWAEGAAKAEVGADLEAGDESVSANDPAAAPVAAEAAGYAARSVATTTDFHPVRSVFVKRMTCAELPPRSLIKWRTSIASYRAEATFFETYAVSKFLSRIVPHAYWVHVDDRLGEVEKKAAMATVEGRGGEGRADDEEKVMMQTLRESCFMMITEDLAAEEASAVCGVSEPTPESQAKEKKAGWEQVGALDVTRAKAIFSATAHLHASFWPSLAAPTPSPPSDTLTKNERSQDQQRQSGDPNLSPLPDDPQPGGVGVRGERRRYAAGLHEQGTFWSLEKRDPGDLAGLEQEYQKLLGHFKPLLPAAWFDGSPSKLPLTEDEEEGRGDTCEGGGEAGGDDGCSKDRYRHRSSGQNGTRVRREASLGRRLAARALDLDAAAHAAHGDEDSSSPSKGREAGAVAAGVHRSGGGGGGRRGRTLVHGDLKTWNVFFRKDWEEGKDKEIDDGGAAAGARVKIIDWQWCGEGLAAADVAYVMCTSLDPSLLPREREFLDHYHGELCRGLEQRFGKPPLFSPVGTGRAGANSSGGGSWYPWEQFMDDYRVAFLDYMRCVVGTIWKGLTPEKMERNRCTGPGMSLINRSSQHLQWMIEKATRLLDELDIIEEERAALAVPSIEARTPVVG